MARSKGIWPFTRSKRVPQSTLSSLKYPDMYHKLVSASKKAYEIIGFVANTERITLMEALEVLLLLGTSRYYGNHITEWNRRTVEDALRGIPATMTPWERKFLKWMRAGGIDAKSFFTTPPTMPRRTAGKMAGQKATRHLTLGDGQAMSGNKDINLVQ